jgi:hypothetical protein
MSRIVVSPQQPRGKHRTRHPVSLAEDERQRKQTEKRCVCWQETSLRLVHRYQPELGDNDG